MNRIATEADKIVYGDYIVPGDLIIDTPTKVLADGSKEVNYYFMAKEWPGIAEGATIWIDGEKLGFTNLLRFRNTSDSLVPWTISKARIKNIPHTQVVTGGISCDGLKDWELDGQCQHYPGLTKWSPSRKFASGHFGFHVKNIAVHGIGGSVLDGGTIKLRGFECQFGFSGVRLNSAEKPVTIESTVIENFYIHDTYDGEGFYLGSTQSGQLPKLKNLKIRNGFLARTGAEAVQVQHLVGGADIRNVILYACDTNWLNAFQSGQDTGIQWVCASGLNNLSYVIVDGYASNGMIPFGSDQDLLNASKGRSVVSNILFNDGRAIGMYQHNSAKFGMSWEYDNLYFRGFNESYAVTGKSRLPYIISRKWGTDPVKFGRIIHDGSKDRVFDSMDGIISGEVILDKEMPAPNYQNSGFTEPASQIMFWHQFYGKYFPNADNTPTKWERGDIAIDRTAGRHLFCKCLVSHTATEVRPADNPAQFEILKWDSNGVRSDQPGYRHGDPLQSAFPPDDLRLKSTCYWRKKGFGVKGVSERLDIVDEYVFDGYRVTVLSDGSVHENIV